VRRRTIPAVLGVTAVTATGLAVATAAGAMASPSSTSATVQKVTVTATEFKFKLSKSTFKVGDVVEFTLVNKGGAPHDWDLEGTKGTAVINPGKSVKIKVTFKKAGELRYICTVPRHAQFGMDASLLVKK
jgi:uncharacterized cupredoxin-like copper-binding protein